MDEQIYINEVMRVFSAAKRFGVSHETIRTRISRGKLKTFRLACGMTVVRVSDVATLASELNTMRVKVDPVTGRRRRVPTR